MKINKSTKQIVKNIIKKSEEIILKRSLNQKFFQNIKNVMQKNKELLRFFLNSMMIFGTIRENIKEHFEKLKQIGINTAVSLIKELSFNPKKQDQELEKFWSNFEKKTPNNELLIQKSELKSLKTQLNKTKWKRKTLDLVHLLGSGFQMIENIFNQKQKKLQMAFQIGNYVGAIYMIHCLEKTLPKVLFLVKKKRKNIIWKQREQLFFIKINFVEKYNEYLRQICPLNFNIFIQKFNYMLS